jgi:hypothetical protein
LSHKWFAAEDEAELSWEADGPEGSAPYTIAKHNRARHHGEQSAQRRERQREELPESRPAVKRQRPNTPEVFRCRHCRSMVGLVPSGGRHRNHCPYCLHSRHVDLRTLGDRLSPCGGTMAPIGAFTRVNGEYSIIHRCLVCGIERHNRIAADDDFELVIALPDMTRWALEQQSLAAAEEEGSAGS